MASAQELVDILNQLKDQRDAVNNAERTPTGFRVGTDVFTEAELKQFLANLDKDIKALNKALKPYLDAEQKLQSAQALGPGQTPSPVQQQVINNARRKFQTVSAQTFQVPTLVTRPEFFAPPATGVSGPVATPAPPTPMEATTRQVRGGQGRRGTTTTTVGPAGPVGPTGGGAVTPVTTPTGGAGGAPQVTGGGGAGGRPGGKGGKKKPPPPQADWEPTFRRMFPAQSWMFDLDRQKYADVFGLFQRAVQQEMFKTSEGIQRFTAELQNTSFYKELQNKGVVQRVRDIVGDTGLPSESFNRIIRDTMNLGWDEATIKREVYTEAFRKDPTTNQYVNPQAQARAKASSDYLSIANIGRQFFSSIDPATIESNLTGGFTVEDVSRQQRELAKTKYAHLSNLIDQGFTLEQLASDYKGIASRLLEKPEADINMSQADFEVALNYNDNGNYRLMTTGEWERMLKTDDRYGYGNTQQAQQKARQIALNLARSLGKVR